MIKEIFLPEKFGHKRILSQRILGVAIQEDVITLSYIHAYRSKTVIDMLLLQAIEAGEDETYGKRVVDALKLLMPKVKKKYDQVRVAIPASKVTFKELQMPFVDPEKIRLVLDYEIESMLPFSLDEAVIDFIITKEIKDQNTSQVLVAAVRNQDMQAVLDMYTQAGIEPTSITIDLFAEYGLYQQIPEYNSIGQGCAIVDVGLDSTRIAFLQAGQLRLTRAIPRGFATIVKNISEELKLEYADVIKTINDRGMKPIGEDAFDKSVQKHVINFFNDIQFTLNSFSLKLNFYEGVARILFLGKLNNLKGIIEFSSNTLQIPSEIFDGKKILINKWIKNKVVDLRVQWGDFVIALGAALPPLQQDDFDLRRKSFILTRHTLLGKQLVTMMIIIVALFAMLGIHGSMQLQELQKALKVAEMRTADKLRALMPVDKKKKVSLQILVRDAEKLVKDKAALWASFSRSRPKMLEVLLEATTLLDKTENDVSITDLVISSKEKEGTKIEMDGYFKSRRGSGNFAEWSPLETKFKESSYFTLLEDPNPQSAEDKGIKFSLKLKVKEKEEK